MQRDGDDPALLALLEELRHRVIDTYGEERAAEGRLKVMLEHAATAVWRVAQESLELSD